jgi:hypothetical protein
MEKMKMSHNELEMMSPFSILSAVNRLLAELPDLLGPEAWSREGHRITTTLEQLEHTRDRQELAKLASQLQSTIAKYDRARTRLNAELHIQADVLGTLDQSLAEIANTLDLNEVQTLGSIAATTYALSWSVESDDIVPLEVLKTRAMSLKEGGVGGAKSVKFSNMSVDLGEVSEIVAGTLLNGFSILEKPHPFLIAAGILLMFRALYKAMTVQITERDASVFWGIIQSRDPQNNTATEHAILETTNRERMARGLSPLNKLEFSNALITLEALKCITAVPDHSRTWRIVERYQVK